ncbi:MAG TPA: hypothetical protein VEX35_05875 [Allosphingosinicella sp.]|nr:hypothetical protein [Allosphingosinicella sp.]
MTMTAMLLAAASQAAAPAPTLPVCSLVTPRGDSIGFVVRGTENPAEIRLTAAPGSAWPAHSVVGRQGTTGFVIGGSAGLDLHLGPESAARQRATTLSRRGGRSAALPVAYGFCEERPAAAAGEEPGAGRHDAGADNPAFDPARWPQDCGLILSDGRRMRLDFTLVDRNRARLQSAQLWPGGPVTMEVRWLNGRGGQVGAFSRRGGPEGVQTMYTQGSRAVKLIRLRQIGEPSAPGLNGYGICGYGSIVRRPGS